MQAQGQIITLTDAAGGKAVIAPEMGGWLLRYCRHLPELGYVEGIHYSQEVVDRYPNQMYAGNPLLFPQVSFSHLPGREHHYTLDGKTYALPQHGFARRSRWKVVGVSQSKLSMQLTDSAETRAAYPCSFVFTVVYELIDGRLYFRQEIENRGATPMPFSTGIHPYLPVPITPQGRRERCFLEISSGKKVIPGKDWQSWTSVPFKAQSFPVGEDVSGTFFLADLERKEIGLVDPDARVRISINFVDAPRYRFVALWANSTDAPFYCIEPWTALPNSLGRNPTELISLNPGEKFEATIWFDISRT